MALSPAQLALYEKQGYLVVDDFLSPHDVTRVAAGIERVVSAHASMTVDDNNFNLEKVGGSGMDASLPCVAPGLFRKIRGAVFNIEEVRAVGESAALLDVVQSIMGSSIYYHSSKVMFKPPKDGSPKPWHQDAAYWAHYEPRQVAAWIAVDDADAENGCVWAVPGSHARGLVTHAGAELQLTDAQADAAAAVPVPVRAGGLLLFHALVVHKSEANRSDRKRRALIFDYDPSPNTAIDADGRAPGGDAVWRLR